MSNAGDQGRWSDGAATVANNMVEAAANLVTALSADQRAQAGFDFPSDDERRLWFYTPTDHGGLPMAEMDSAQHRLVHRLLAVSLSQAGYNTAAIIQSQENLLDRLENFTTGFQRPRGRDPLLYWIAVFGQPSLEGVWGWRFGGHHISLNFTMVDGRIVSTTPSFFGADPASTPLLGPHLHRPLAAVEDLGRELVRSLSPEQSDRAVVAPVPPLDLVSANRSELSEGDRPIPLPLIWRGRLEAALDTQMAEVDRKVARSLGLTDEHVDAVAFSVAPKGLPGSALSGDQREMLKQLLLTYVGRVHDDLADREAAKLTDEGLDTMHFLWAGGLEVGDPHYYRIQGGDLFAEYDNAQRNANHIHTVWRDLSQDFGGDALARHYTTGHPH